MIRQRDGLEPAGTGSFPLYLFTICSICALPLVIYHALIKDVDSGAKQIAVGSISPDVSRPNILMVTFDAMTARYMSLYGYHRPTTPFISEWSETATVFTKAQAASNFTRPTIASINTGKRVWSHQIYHSNQRSWPVKIKTENMPLLLKKNGYFNISLMSSFESSDGSVSKFFDIVVNPTELSRSETLLDHLGDLLYKLFGDRFILYDWLVREDFAVSFLLSKVSMDSSVTKSRPQIAFNKFLSILANGVPEPYFAWVHLMPPHATYLPPEKYKGMFDSSPELRTMKSQDKLLHNKNIYNSCRSS